jgi:hypothetical protein
MACHVTTAAGRAAGRNEYDTVECDSVPVLRLETRGYIRTQRSCFNGLLSRWASPARTDGARLPAKSRLGRSEMTALPHPLDSDSGSAPDDDDHHVAPLLRAVRGAAGISPPPFLKQPLPLLGDRPAALIDLPRRVRDSRLATYTVENVGKFGSLVAVKSEEKRPGSRGHEAAGQRLKMIAIESIYTPGRPRCQLRGCAMRRTILSASSP